LVVRILAKGGEEVLSVRRGGSAREKGEGGTESEQVLTVRKTVGHEIEEQVLSVWMGVAKTKKQNEIKK